MKKIVFAAVFGLALASTAPASADHAWAARAPMQAPTEGHCSAVIGNNIYTAYGFQPATGDSNVLKIYDIDKDTWSFGPPSPAAGRSEMYRGVAHGGKLYCVGGRTNPLQSNTSFDASTWTWTTLAPVPSLRVGATAVVVDDAIYLIGGRVGAAPCTPPAVPGLPGPFLNNILRYDILTNTWSNAGNLAVARSDTTAAVLGDQVYIFGGCNGAVSFDSVERYDPATQTSTLLPAMMPGGARANAAATATSNRLIRVTGGWRTGGGAALNANNDLIFDKMTETFTVGTPMPTHCTDPNANRGEHETVFHGNRIYAIGGACPAFGTSIANLDVLKLNP